MNTDKKVRFPFICVYLCSSVVSFLQFGCGGPSAANIELRKQLQAKESQLDDLKRQHDADVATIHAFEQRQQSSGAIVPALPAERLEKLFTTHGISLGRLTGSADLDP